MATKKSVTKGKRYTPEEKAKIVAFVENHNATNGRGGVTAAVKEFGASNLSIASWVKSGPKPGKVSKGANAKVTTGKRTDMLTELAKLDRLIATKRVELDSLEAKFQNLKAKL